MLESGRSAADTHTSRVRTNRCRHRHVRKNTTYLVTKKCADGAFLLVPNPRLNQALLYLLALKAGQYGILVHAYCFLSNHFHLVVTDVDGTLPVFMREFLGETSKAVQVISKLDRAIWARKRYSAVELLDLDATERKIAYTILNPTRADLTEPGDWPGATSASTKFGDHIVVDRPNQYFSNRRPEQVRLALEPAVAKLHFRSNTSDEHERQRATMESNARIDQLVAAGRDESASARERAKKGLLGAARVLHTARDHRCPRPIRRRNPRFASRCAALLAAAVERYQQFENDHSRAKERYLAGDLDVLFPEGTYGYRMLFGVRSVVSGSAA